MFQLVCSLLCIRRRMHPSCHAHQTLGSNRERMTGCQFESYSDRDQLSKTHQQTSPLMNAVESTPTVALVKPQADLVLCSAATTTAQVATKSASNDKNQVDSDGSAPKKKKWYKRIKLQPVIYRGKCCM